VKKMSRIYAGYGVSQTPIILYSTRFLLIPIPAPVIPPCFSCFNPLFYEVPTYTLGIKKEAKRLLNVLILYSTRFLLILQRYGLFISLVQVLILYSTRFLLILLEFCCKSSRVWWVLILYSTRFLLIPSATAILQRQHQSFNPLFYEVPTYTLISKLRNMKLYKF